MGSLDHVQKEYQEIQETEQTSEATILTMLAGGKPYVFIVPEVTGEYNEKLVLHLSTNIPSSSRHILRTVLQGTLETIPED